MALTLCSSLNIQTSVNPQELGNRAKLYQAWASIYSKGNLKHMRQSVVPLVERQV